jgi:PhnB protein
MIENLRRFTGFDTFCDEEGTTNRDLPAMDWDNRFEGDDKRTDVRVTITFVSAEDMQRIVEMGFKEGFTMGLDQLDQLLQGEG